MASRGVKYCVRVRVWESARRDGKQCDQKELKKTNLKKKNLCVAIAFISPFSTQTMHIK
jgi:hypothetical protein